MRTQRICLWRAQPLDCGWAVQLDSSPLPPSGWRRRRRTSHLELWVTECWSQSSR